MSEIGIQQVLSQMRAMAAQLEGPAATGPEPAAGAAGAGGVDFGQLLSDSIDKVNTTQREADAMATAFVKGEGEQDLAKVMIEVQRANISFQAMAEVRNRLVSAYQEIMNMPV